MDHETAPESRLTDPFYAPIGIDATTEVDDGPLAPGDYVMWMRRSRNKRSIYPVNGRVERASKGNVVAIVRRQCRGPRSGASVRRVVLRVGTSQFWKIPQFIVTVSGGGLSQQASEAINQAIARAKGNRPKFHQVVAIDDVVSLGKSTPEERAKVVEWFGKTLGKKRAFGAAESKEGDG